MVPQKNHISVSILVFLLFSDNLRQSSSCIPFKERVYNLILSISISDFVLKNFKLNERVIKAHPDWTHVRQRVMERLLRWNLRDWWLCLDTVVTAAAPPACWWTVINRAMDPSLSTQDLTHDRRDCRGEEGKKLEQLRLKEVSGVRLRKTSLTTRTATTAGDH